MPFSPKADNTMKLVELLCLFLLMKTCMTSEPYCRQYDYDEKLLSKMIRTEIALESLTREMNAMESALESKLRQVTEDLENKLQVGNSRPVKSEGKAIGFTVSAPDKSKSDTKGIIFSTVQTNVGGSYNKKTGRFQCKIPGLYSFTVIILRSKESTSAASCYIKVNDASIVFAYAHSRDTNEHPSGAAHLTVQLNERDEVYLGDCLRVDNFEGGTHFTGFMISQI